jgi:bifunctional enzyme CysN/CysC
VTLTESGEEASPPLSVSVTLEDEIDVSRGDVLARPDNRPRVDREFEAMVVWMAEQPMASDTQYLFKQTNNIVGGTVRDIRYRIDINELASEDANTLQLNEVGRCHISLTRAIPFDPYRKNRTTGAFIIIDRLTNNTVGAGMILDRKTGEGERLSFWEEGSVATMLEQQTSPVSEEERAKRFGHKAKTILLTGLTGSGKSTIAYALERRLFDSGQAVTVLDGDNMRLGISKDLGFSATERSENIRRASEVAKLINDTGLICICAFVAPSAEIREKAARNIGEDRFIEVHVATSLETCRKRDTKGHYAKADSGEIESLPGISAPYDKPESPALILETDKLDVDECVDLLMRMLEK